MKVKSKAKEQLAAKRAKVKVPTTKSERPGRKSQVLEELREKEERYKALFDRSLFCVYVHDFKGNFLDANRAALDLFGYTKEDIPSLSFLSLLEEDHLSRALEILEEIKQTGVQKKPAVLKIRKKDGGYVWVEAESTTIDRRGKPYAIQGIARDITEHKKMEEELQTSVREKELLLKEVHHRVKNNMQLICSLLSLQSSRLKDKEALEMFTNCQNRIRSMQLIHEKLYQSKNLGKIEFAPYIQSLAVHLFNSYNAGLNLISLKTEMEGVTLDINTAISCGLIINELISNCLKHAFPKDRTWRNGERLKGEIRISLGADKSGLFTLVVGDNGVGLPEDLDFRETESLGLKLVMDLVDQLHGSITLEKGRGTVFNITFSAQA